MGAALPYWRLSGVYFFYFSILGVLSPYWAPYLRSQGFSAGQIGELVALLHVTRIIAPNLWGWMIDRAGRRMLIVRLTCTAALISFVGVLLGSAYWWMALTMAVFSMFWNAVLPQFEANTMNHLRGRETDYSKLRLWGSVGFIVAVLVLGELIDRYDEGVVPWALVLLFGALIVASLFAPERRPRLATDAETPFAQVVMQPSVLGFLTVCFLLQASHGPYYAFYTIYLQDHGHSSGVIGVLWALGVVAEIGVFLVMHRLLLRYGPKLLITAALTLAAARWALIGEFAHSVWILAGAQFFHAGTFGIYHAVGIHVINRYFVGRNQGRGQALYSSLTFGAGVAIGSLVSGYLWLLLGGRATFLAAAGLAAGAALLAHLRLPDRTFRAESRVRSGRTSN